MHAFFRSALTQITLPDTLCTIDELAFEDCPNLESLSFPASVTCIGDQPDWDSPVADCPKLQSITVDPANLKYFSIPPAKAGRLTRRPLWGDMQTIPSWDAEL